MDAGKAQMAPVALSFQGSEAATPGHYTGAGSVWLCSTCHATSQRQSFTRKTATRLQVTETVIHSLPMSVFFCFFPLWVIFFTL